MVTGTEVTFIKSESDAIIWPMSKRCVSFRQAVFKSITPASNPDLSVDNQKPLVI